MSNKELLLAARYLISAKHRRLMNLERLHVVSDLVAAISGLIHELQKERGAWNVYLGSGGRMFADEIAHQGELCTERERAVRACFEALDSSPHRAAIFSRIGVILRDLDSLPALRRDGRALKLTTRDTIAAFSLIIGNLLAVVSEANDVTADGDIAQRLIALFNYMQGKEFAGQERATGVAAFSVGRFDTTQHRRFLSLISAQNRAFQIFADHAPPDLLAAHRVAMGGPWAAPFDRARLLARDAGLSGALDAVTGPAWFDLATLRINAMKGVEDHIAADLRRLCAQRLTEAVADFHAPVPGGLRVRIAVSIDRRRLVAQARRDRSLAVGMRAMAAPPPGSPAWVATAIRLHRGGADDVETLAAQQREERRLEEERRQTLEDAVHDFGATSESVVSSLAGMAQRMNENAARMTENAGAVNRRAHSMADASRESLAGVHTVARAAEELADSIGDLNRQADQSLRITAEAVTEVSRTNEATEGLRAAADRIGEVVGLIQSIASRTNLLALNATIEAARAGDAGRGFAVVAGEVKALANQTAQATGDIVRQVESIQSASSAVVGTIGTIRGIVASMDDTIGRVASALTQQQAATGRIAATIQQIAGGAGTVATGVDELAGAAADNGTMAGQVLEAAQELETLTRTMSGNLGGFMAKVRVGTHGL